MFENQANAINPYAAMAKQVAAQQYANNSEPAPDEIGLVAKAAYGFGDARDRIDSACSRLERILDRVFGSEVAQGAAGSAPPPPPSMPQAVLLGVNAGALEGQIFRLAGLIDRAERL